MNSLNICFCIFKYFPYGGLQRDFKAIMDACVARGHRVSVITTQWQSKTPDNIRLITLSVKGFTNHARLQNYVQKALQTIHQRQYDVVIGFECMPTLDIYFAGSTCFAAKAENRSFIYRLLPRYKLFTSLERAVFQNTNTTILSINEKEQEKFQQYYKTKPTKFIKIPPGIPRRSTTIEYRSQSKQKLIHQYRLKENSKFLLMVGSHYHTKGLDRILIAFSSMKSSNTVLFIVGKGDTSKYKKQAKKLDILQNVIFVGPSDKVYKYLCGADFLVHTPRTEMGGNVLLEALTAGLPVLTTANCGYAHYILEANAGFVLPTPFSQDTLNDQLENKKNFIGSDDYHTMVRAALDYAATKDLYSLAEKTADVIESL